MKTLLTVLFIVGAVELLFFGVLVHYYQVSDSSFYFASISQLLNFPVSDETMLIISAIIISLFLVVLGHLGPSVFFSTQSFYRLRRDWFEVLTPAYEKSVVSWLALLTAGPHSSY